MVLPPHVVKVTTLATRFLELSENRWTPEVATGVHRVAQAGPRMLAFILGVAIASVGAVGILAPSGLVWIARQVLDVGALAFYVVATVRIAFGALLVSVASASRSPRALRAVGCFIVALGIATALTPAFAMERAPGEIQWLVQHVPA